MKVVALCVCMFAGTSILSTASATPLDLLSFTRATGVSARQIGVSSARTYTALSGYAPGTIVVRTGERKLYLTLEGGWALAYRIGVGRVGFTWTGRSAVSAMREWPDWTPPAQMIARQPHLPRFMAGGPHNPLGARALYLGNSLYRIHGSNEPKSIGSAVSSGCFRMHNADAIDLYARVRVGTPVFVER